MRVNDARTCHLVCILCLYMGACILCHIHTNVEGALFWIMNNQVQWGLGLGLGDGPLAYIQWMETCVHITGAMKILPKFHRQK